MDYIVRKQVETIEVVIYVHGRLEVKDKENQNAVVVYRNCLGKLERSWPNEPCF